jgi:phosphomannomutase
MRFSINPSTTEPVLRLNFESCGSPKQLVRQADDIVQWVWQHEKLSHAGLPTLKIA